MSMIGIKIGWTVRLKSGGPVMTVTKVDREEVECSWFHDGELRQGKFNREALKDASPEASPSN
jgi:uncharacterized protein YodC (DUF2158 family)